MHVVQWLDFSLLPRGIGQTNNPNAVPYVFKLKLALAKYIFVFHLVCALDENYYAADGLYMPLTCDVRGEYVAWQILNRSSFCVDADGFAVSDFVDIGQLSDCDRYLYYRAD